jgi:hypothetical protein
MATTVLGRVTMIPRGNYTNGETYRYLELVRFSGASYMCRVAITTNAPTNTTDWVLLAQDGASIGEGSPTDIDGIIKGDGTEFTVATPHTDYAMPTTGSYLLKGNGTGGFADASNDYQVKLVNTVGAGQNIKTINNVPVLGTGDISIATAVNSGGSTNITGLLKGNGSTLSAASAGTDYVIPSALNNYSLTTHNHDGVYLKNVPGDYFISKDYTYFCRVNFTDQAFNGNTCTVQYAGSNTGFWFETGTYSSMNSLNGVTSLGRPGATWSNIYLANAPVVSSDSRLKTEVTNELGLNFIQALRPVAFKWNIGGYVGEPDNLQPIPGVRHHYGFLAQEVKQALDSVSCSDFGGWMLADHNDPASQQSLRLEEFIAPIVKAIQELTVRLEALENTNA